MSRPFAVIVALALLLGGSTAISAPPKAEINGPATRKSGASILLDARNAVSDKTLVWKLIEPKDRVFLVFDLAAKRQVFFFVPDAEDGEYLVSLTAVGKVGEELEADTAIHRVVVGAPPTPVPPTPVPTPPTPPPTPAPEDVFGFYPYILDVVAKTVPVAERITGARPIAAAYRETVRLGRDGKFATPKEMVADAVARMSAARPASWSGFVIAPKLTELARAGKLATVADLVKAFEQIAIGLERIADGY